MRCNPLVLAVTIVMLAAALEAGAVCTAGLSPNPVIESTPTSAFTNNGNGTVTHNLTGLMWKQCTQGQNSTGCAGTATKMTWRAALAAAAADTTAGYSDWRLPNDKELDSIVESCGYSPTINLAVFPSSPDYYVWTGTTYASYPPNAWYVDFSGGLTFASGKSGTYYARLVRGGQSFDTFDAQTVRPPVVVEYRDTADFPNSPGGHFFYSSDAAEQAAIDAGAAGAFVRTGRQFLTGGTSPVCRFYGSMTPGPNSHFFTVDVAECNALKAAQVTPAPATVQQWNYEGVSYSTTPASVAPNGVRSCPATTQPLYRAYNNAYPPSGPKNPWDSNHRFTPALSDIAAMVAGGWRDEGIVFCTAQ